MHCVHVMVFVYSFEFNHWYGLLFFYFSFNWFLLLTVIKCHYRKSNMYHSLSYTLIPIDMAIVQFCV